MVETQNEKQERALLVGLVTAKQNLQKMQENLDELAFLAETAGAIPVEQVYQNLHLPDNRTYVGSGKLAEIKQIIRLKAIDVLIFDDEISPAQQRNIEKETKIKVLDRSMLILDIFAQRARTTQAKLQVELAQQQYLLPRLRGMWQHLDRVKGGIGMRGAGEKEIETDRRIAGKRIALLKQRLVQVEKQDINRRKSREGMIRLALVGYTNVGKSTIMNALSKSTVLAENKLFATLDTTVRKVAIGHVPFLLSDTVGFIRKLPHHLVESFKSTLNEALEADLLIHVVDLSHPQFEDQMQAVKATLADLHCEDKPELVVFNKLDVYRERYFDKYTSKEVQSEILEGLQRAFSEDVKIDPVFISATQKENMNVLRKRIFEETRKLYIQRYPYKASYVPNWEPDWEDHP
ncbi:MAG: GTPase HflX [Bacteroidota bacterium]|nr:GTPase HflX [Bacteroidota bacterium]MEC8032861.1 GTPase HflX [Bacteroidota bacterium]MEC8757738.1 GTPase HflX [Bacteroidota bacterium]MEC8835999.1 GTPase HflX [Bacteroidota bacterium]